MGEVIHLIPSEDSNKFTGIKEEAGTAYSPDGFEEDFTFRKYYILGKESTRFEYNLLKLREWVKSKISKI